MNYKELKEQLIKANEAYYKDSSPIMSDYEFDQKLKELEKMEKEQDWSDVDSPTRKPGSDLTIENYENKHGRYMLSLENTYNLDEIAKWYSDMQDATGLTNPEVVVNPKWDGNSGALRFNQQGLYKALTRGNGEVGEDITQNVKYCADNIWPTKQWNGNKFLGEARGEIIMTKAGFNRLNEAGKYQNARNLVSGSLKLLDIYEFIPRAEYIDFYAYWLEDSENLKYSEDLAMLKFYGFTVGDYYVCKSIEEIKSAIDKIEKTEFPVEIDGAVMKLNNKIYWEQIGSTAKFPRWAKAYKYKQQTATTTVKNITYEVGRTGKITGLCWFEPVFLDGSTIQKATLNNKEWQDAMDIAVGDTIEVQKAAAIIPQIIDVVERPANRKIIPFPTVCPTCGSKLVKHNEDHNDWFCDNSSCKSRIIDQIINYTHSLEIDGFAEIIVEKMHNIGILNSISDLYKLKDHKEEISKLDRLSMNMAEKLCKNIEDSKTNDFWKLLAGLGIPNVGPKTAKILVKKYKSIEELSNATSTELQDLDDIAEITATGIVKWFSENNALIKEIIASGAKVSVASKEKTSSANLSGMTFCITGALSKPRDSFISLIENAGGKVVGGVSSKTTYLITNDKTTGTAKNKKAEELGIPILNEEEFMQLLRGDK